MPLASSSRPIFVKPQAWVTSSTAGASSPLGMPNPSQRHGFGVEPLSREWQNLRRQDKRLDRLQRPLYVRENEMGFRLSGLQSPASSEASGGSMRAAGTQLLLTAASWGTVPVVTRMLFLSLTQQPSSWLCTALANVGAFMYLGTQVAMEQGATRLLRCRRSIRGGCELAAWYFTGAVTLLLGLQLTSATEAAFISQLCTLIVPMVTACQGAKISISTWAACILAFAGCTTLGSGGTSAGGVSVHGVVLLLASAFAFAFHNIRLNAHAEGCNTDLLAFWSKAGQAAFALAALALAVRFGLCQDPGSFVSLASAWDLAFLGLWVAWTGVIVRGCTAVWQAEAYKVVSPSEAEVVLAAAPLFSLGLAVLFLGEPLTARTMTGAGLFVTALGLTAGAKGEGQPALKELDEEAALKGA